MPLGLALAKEIENKINSLSLENDVSWARLLFYKGVYVKLNLSQNCNNTLALVWWACTHTHTHLTVRLSGGSRMSEKTETY